jgi:hypothetical protein
LGILPYKLEQKPILDWQISAPNEKHPMGINTHQISEHQKSDKLEKINK